MQLIRFVNGSEAEIGVLIDHTVVSVRRAVQLASLRRPAVQVSPKFAELFTTEPKVLLACWSAVRPILEEVIASEQADATVTANVSDLHVLPFVGDPDKVIGMSYNYRTLSKQENVAMGAVPQAFGKTPGCLVGAYEDVLVPPAIENLDFEAELCIVVGRTARNVSLDEAAACIAGYTVMNEMTAKILPRPKTDLETIQLRLKGVDNVGPLGAVVVTADELTDLTERHMSCTVNGEQRQNFPVSDWVYAPEEVVSFLSGIMTLRPGDLIAMGTSSGIGIADVPPRLLKDGDVVEVELNGFAGTRNVIHFDSTPERAWRSRSK